MWWPVPTSTDSLWGVGLPVLGLERLTASTCSSNIARPSLTCSPWRSTNPGALPLLLPVWNIECSVPRYLLSMAKHVLFSLLGMGKRVHLWLGWPGVGSDKAALPWTFLREAPVSSFTGKHGRQFVHESCSRLSSCHRQGNKWHISNTCIQSLRQASEHIKLPSRVKNW